jgi:hypothetical protein
LSDISSLDSIAIQVEPLKPRQFVINHTIIGCMLHDDLFLTVSGSLLDPIAIERELKPLVALSGLCVLFDCLAWYALGTILPDLAGQSVVVGLSPSPLCGTLS